MLSQGPPLNRPDGYFADAEHALMAGWFDELAIHGFTGVLSGACEDVPELLFVSLPGSHGGADWIVHYEHGVFVIERLGVRARPVFLAKDLRAALRFAAPLPPGCLEPKPMAGASLPKVMPDSSHEAYR